MGTKTSGLGLGLGVPLHGDDRQSLGGAVGHIHGGNNAMEGFLAYYRRWCHANSRQCHESPCHCTQIRESPRTPIKYHDSRGDAYTCNSHASPCLPLHGMAKNRRIPPSRGFMHIYLSAMNAVLQGVPAVSQGVKLYVIL